MSDLGLSRYLLDDLAARWCASSVAALAEGREIPVYGSVEWQQADIRLQIAAAVRAGEMYRRDGLFRAQALTDEAAAALALLDDADMRAYAELADRMEHYDRYGAAWWKAQANLPSHAELVARRSA